MAIRSQCLKHLGFDTRTDVENKQRFFPRRRFRAHAVRPYANGCPPFPLRPTLSPASGEARRCFAGRAKHRFAWRWQPTRLLGETTSPCWRSHKKTRPHPFRVRPLKFLWSKGSVSDSCQHGLGGFALVGIAFFQDFLQEFARAFDVAHFLVGFGEFEFGGDFFAGFQCEFLG